MQDVLYKDPAAVKNYTVDFTEILDDTDTAISATSAVATDTNGDVQAAVIGTLTDTGMVLTVPLQAGEDGEDYVIIIKATGNNSAEIGVQSLELRVRVEEIGNF